MKKIISVLIRLLGGIALLVAILVALFAFSLRRIHQWGATREELALTRPGDDLYEDPIIKWTHAITINAPPEDVWPWIAQLGDTRGGFYSYTFIENQVGAITGAQDYNVVYINANRIYPEWQNPSPGDEIIQGQLQIQDVEEGEYLVANSIDPSTLNWVWSWSLEPVEENKTRMYIRFAIEVPGGNENPVMGFMMDVGGFVMEKNMMEGIKTRAEGRSEPAWIEPLEIGLWFTALLTGLAAGILYLFKRSWLEPLIVAITAVIVIFTLTIVQPAIAVRLVLDVFLVAGLIWSFQA